MPFMDMENRPAFADIGFGAGIRGAGTAVLRDRYAGRGSGKVLRTEGEGGV